VKGLHLSGLRLAFWGKAGWSPGFSSFACQLLVDTFTHQSSECRGHGRTLRETDHTVKGGILREVLVEVREGLVVLCFVNNLSIVHGWLGYWSCGVARNFPTGCGGTAFGPWLRTRRTRSQSAASELSTPPTIAFRLRQATAREATNRR
jgi:hypothetical protein